MKRQAHQRQTQNFLLLMRPGFPPAPAGAALPMLLLAAVWGKHSKYSISHPLLAAGTDGHSLSDLRLQMTWYRGAGAARTTRTFVCRVNWDWITTRKSSRTARRPHSRSRSPEPAERSAAPPGTPTELREERNCRVLRRQVTYQCRAYCGMIAPSRLMSLSQDGISC